MAEEEAKKVEVEVTSEPTPPPPESEPTKDVTEEKSVIPQPAPEEPKPDDSKALAVVESEINSFLSFSFFFNIGKFCKILGEFERILLVSNKTE